MLQTAVLFLIYVKAQVDLMGKVNFNFTEKSAMPNATLMSENMQ